MAQVTPPDEKKHWVEEITQPFIDLVHAPRALWGINLAYFLEGWVYFGMLGYLAMHFSDNIFKDAANPDILSHHMVLVLTAGITISMFFFGSVADKKGIRKTLLTAFVFLLIGRIIISAAPFLFGQAGEWSPMHITTMVGILIVVVGYGLYQPAAYAGVKKFTSGKTAAMGFAMLYALMNLGGWLPSFFSPIRNSIGIPGTFWVYTSITVVALIATSFILTRKVEQQAITQAEKERAVEEAEAAKTDTEAQKAEKAEKKAVDPIDRNAKIPLHLWFTLAAIAGCVYLLPATAAYVVWGLFAATLITCLLVPMVGTPVRIWLANHPLSNTKFFFFIFALIPVQTLFTYNWLILPQYLARAFDGFIGEKFELFANLNPILIFVAVPIVTALTYKKSIYKMMIIGTFIMAVPAFFLAFGTSIYTLLAYLLVMTIGEAMWQPRFLQYAAQIAPEGRTGAYMGVAQFPWFLTKVIVPLYSGLMLQRYCPSEGIKNPESMWLIFAIIAMISPIVLVLAKGWIGKDLEKSH